MADMWSFGCVVLEMGTAQSPWGSLGVGESWSRGSEGLDTFFVGPSTQILRPWT